jgi:hypothetical protein
VADVLGPRLIITFSCRHVELPLQRIDGALTGAQQA